MTLPPGVILQAVDPREPASADVLSKLQGQGYGDLVELLEKRDGAYLLVDELPKQFPCPQHLSRTSSGRASPGDYWQAWELGRYYLIWGRDYEALALFRRLYEHMLDCEGSTGENLHKAMPLVWIRECHSALGHPVLAKRYMMLTAIEDAIFHQGIVPRNAGVYFRLVWKYGMSQADLERYSSAAAQIDKEHPDESRYPEWILQRLDQDWITEFPSAREAARFEVSRNYVNFLVASLGTARAVNWSC